MEREKRLELSTSTLATWRSNQLSYSRGLTFSKSPFDSWTRTVGQGRFRKMKIYTKHGDQGETGLFGGDRVPKDHLRIRAYGTLDELNAALGLALAAGSVDASFTSRLRRIQSEIFQLGSELATPRGKTLTIALIEDDHVREQEKEIDEMEKSLSPLTNFILPGGGLVAAHLHLARTICRRAEREMVILHRAESIRPVVLQYVNRLSDYLFVASRFANHAAGVADIPWVAVKKTV